MAIIIRLLTAFAALFGSISAANASPVAKFSEISYRALDVPEVTPGTYRNPILPGFHPDPSIVKVGKDFYLVTSTFGWFPGLPVFHSTDLVNWRQIGNAIDRPGMVDFSGTQLVWEGLYAPAINYHDGLFYIVNTCVVCRGNFYITAEDPAGPWSDPVWLDFEGIDPSLFFDDDGRAWMVNNGIPDGEIEYDGHRAIWIQQFDVASGKLIGPRKVMVDKGVHPEDKPIWAEGPHLYKHDGWYYLMPAEGGTADQHSQTIYRSKTPDGPYEPGSFNPILTQRDLPKDRPDRVEATGHADLVKLDDGSWWGVFLGTRPYAEQLTLLGRESFLLPVRWVDGWPRFLDPGEAVPLAARAPDLPASPGTDWGQWTETFDAPLSSEWLQMLNPSADRWYVLDREHGHLRIEAGEPGLANARSKMHFLGRRLRHHSASYTARLTFAPERQGDFGGLAAIMAQGAFVAVGIEGGADGAPLVAVRRRAGDGQGDNGALVASAPLSGSGEIEVQLTLDKGAARFAWRAAGEGAWRELASGVDITHMASVNSALFTGTAVGPYASRGAD